VYLRGKSHVEWRITRGGERRTVKEDQYFIDEKALVWGRGIIIMLYHYVLSNAQTSSSSWLLSTRTSLQHVSTKLFLVSTYHNLYLFKNANYTTVIMIKDTINQDR